MWQRSLPRGDSWCFFHSEGLQGPVDLVPGVMVGRHMGQCKAAGKAGSKPSPFSPVPLLLAGPLVQARTQLTDRP